MPAAMTPKPEDEMPFQGIPEAIYMDNGPVTRSWVFQNVMACLGVRIMTHIPAGKDGSRVTTRSKGKVESWLPYRHGSRCCAARVSRKFPSGRIIRS